MPQIQQVLLQPFRAKKTIFKSIPELNLDKKHYTPLFVLEEDKVQCF